MGNHDSRSIDLMYQNERKQPKAIEADSPDCADLMGQDLNIDLLNQLYKHGQVLRPSRQFHNLWHVGDSDKAYSAEELLKLIK